MLLWDKNPLTNKNIKIVFPQSCAKGNKLFPLNIRFSVKINRNKMLYKSYKNTFDFKKSFPAKFWNFLAQLLIIRLEFDKFHFKFWRINC